MSNNQIVDVLRLQDEPMDSFSAFKNYYVVLPPAERTLRNAIALANSNKLLDKNVTKHWRKYYNKYSWEARALEFDKTKRQLFFSEIGIDFDQLRETYNAVTLEDVKTTRDLWLQIIEGISQEILDGTISASKAAYAYEKAILAREKIDVIASRRLGLPLNISQTQQIAPPAPQEVQIIFTGGDDDEPASQDSSS